MRLRRVARWPSHGGRGDALEARQRRRLGRVERSGFGMGVLSFASCLVLNLSPAHRCMKELCTELPHGPRVQSALHLSPPITTIP